MSGSKSATYCLEVSRTLSASLPLTRHNGPMRNLVTLRGCHLVCSIAKRLKSLVGVQGFEPWTR